MKKAAVRKNTTSANGEEVKPQRATNTFDARQHFYLPVLNMSWQLALTVIIPVVGGVKLDERFGTSPSLTLAGFFLATFAAAMVVWNTVKGVNEMQAAQEKKLNKRNKSA